MGTIARKTWIKSVLLNSHIEAKVKKSKTDQAIWNLRLNQLKVWIQKEEIQLPMTLATQEEVKDKLKDTQEMDEAKVIRHLASRAADTSVSAKIIETWILSRTKEREILQHLSKERQLQTTFINLIGSTRFKAVKAGKSHHTNCPRCQVVDSWEHCMQCYEVKIQEGQGKASGFRT